MILREIPSILGKVLARKGGSGFYPKTARNFDVAGGLTWPDRYPRSDKFHPAYLRQTENEKTLGIVGIGKVGKAMARRAKGFNMKILYHDMQRFPETESELGVVYASFEDLLKRSDFVTLHPLYTPETHHLISARELSLMKPTAFLINTSRGPVVDQEALIEAIRQKEIAGVALDVFEGEPHPRLPEDFVAMKNVVLTPHFGSAVTEKREIMSNTVVDMILDFMQGKRPDTLFNPDIYDE